MNWKISARKHSHTCDIHTFTNGCQLASLDEVVTSLKTDRDFRSILNRTLANSRFASFFLECKPMHQQRINEPFEMALIDAPALMGLRVDPSAFNDHFEASHDGIVVFRNLSDDANLVVPKPEVDTATYLHLAEFCRNGPHAQIDAFWKQVGLEMHKRLEASSGGKCTWLSTSGLGVPFLHMRVSETPKYYCHAPYRRCD